MDQYQWLGFLIGAVLLIFVGTLAGVILWLIATGKINLEKLISEPNGDASLSRFQFLIFTFIIVMSLFYLTATSSEFPDVPAQILGLLGISGGSYVVSKGIQTSRDTHMEELEVTKTDLAPPDPTRTGSARTSSARTSSARTGSARTDSKKPLRY